MSELNISNRLLRVAAGKRSKKKKKYEREVENAFDAVQEQLESSMGYDQSNRAIRLMSRIKSALMAEGYKFVDTSNGATMSTLVPLNSGTRMDNPDDNLPLTCVGSLCMLLPTRPPKDLTRDRVEFLASLFRGKQCYKFTLKPRDKSLVRKTGKNKALPKPVTWPRVVKHGVEMELRNSESSTLTATEYRLEGIRAYTFDHLTFFTANAGMCGRWCDGMNRIVSRALDK